MWKNIVEPGRPQLTIWRMRIACWIPKATITQSVYVILIDFQLQQWLSEPPSMYLLYFLCVFVVPYVYLLYYVCVLLFLL